MPPRPILYLTTALAFAGPARAQFARNWISSPSIAPGTITGTPLSSYGAATPGGNISTAITAAMADTTSPLILIPSGTFTLSAATYTAASGVSFQGAGANKTILQLPAVCALTGNIFQWTAKSNIYLRDLTIDLNGCTTTALEYGVIITGGSQIHIERVNVINSGSSNIILLGFNGSTNVWVKDGYFSLNANGTAQNQCILVGSSYAAATDYEVSGNTCVNTAMEFNVVRLNVHDNDIYGWAFGSGVVMDQTTTATHNIVAHNKIHDSATGQDVNNTYPSGIENWAPYSINDSNQIYNVAGSGIYMGSPHQQITGNVIYGIGKRSDSLGAPAISCGYTSSTYNCDYGAISGYTASDDGSGTTTYGYADLANVTGSLVSANYFAGALGATQIIGGSQLGVGTIDNRVQNPCFAVDQRHEGGFTGPPSNNFLIDRWYGASSHSDMNFQRVVKVMPGCNNAMAPRVATQRTPTSTDYDTLSETIEAQNLYDLGYGTSAAKTMAFDFCVNFPVTGTFGAALQNTNSVRSYAVTYSVAVANTTQCYSYIVPGDTSGNLTNTPTAAGIEVVFNTGSGSANLSATTNAWVAGIYQGGASSTAFTASAANTIFYISSVRLYPTLQDINWIPRTYADELQGIERYYAKTFSDGVAPAQNAGQAGAFGLTAPTSSLVAAAGYSFPVAMRIAPTVTLFSPSAASANCYDETGSTDSGAASAVNVGTKGLIVKCATGSGGSALDVLGVHMTLDADLH